MVWEHDLVSHKLVETHPKSNGRLGNLGSVGYIDTSRTISSSVGKMISFYFCCPLIMPFVPKINDTTDFFIIVGNPPTIVAACHSTIDPSSIGKSVQTPIS